MGLGGQITGLMGLTGNYPKAQTPNPGNVGQDYLANLSNYMAGTKRIYNTEATYLPKFAELSAGTLGSIRSLMSAQDPGGAALLRLLGQQAGEQLGSNGALDPAMRRNLQENVRAGQAARGFGFGPGDAAMEGYYETQGQEARRAQNQQLAEGVIGLMGNYFGTPAGMTQMAVAGAEPRLTPSNVSYDIFNTGYNAEAAKNITNANNRLAMLSGFNSMD